MARDESEPLHYGPMGKGAGEIGFPGTKIQDIKERLSPLPRRYRKTAGEQTPTKNQIKRAA